VTPQNDAFIEFRDGWLADTVCGMSKSPSRFAAKREIEQPRPRDLETTYTKEFSDIVHDLRSQIGAVRKPAVVAA
jgi:NitT/TauT family transport system ATP-binding protein